MVKDLSSAEQEQLRTEEEEKEHANAFENSLSGDWDLSSIDFGDLLSKPEKQEELETQFVKEVKNHEKEAQLLKDDLISQKASTQMLRDEEQRVLKEKDEAILLNEKLEKQKRDIQEKQREMELLEKSAIHEKEIQDRELEMRKQMTDIQLEQKEQERRAVELKEREDFLSQKRKQEEELFKEKEKFFQQKERMHEERQKMYQEFIDYREKALAQDKAEIDKIRDEQRNEFAKNNQAIQNALLQNTINTVGQTGLNPEKIVPIRQDNFSGNFPKASEEYEDGYVPQQSVVLTEDVGIKQSNGINGNASVYNATEISSNEDQRPRFSNQPDAVKRILETRAELWKDYSVEEEEEEESYAAPVQVEVKTEKVKKKGLFGIFKRRK